MSVEAIRSEEERLTFTLQEVAAMLGLSARTIRRLVDARKFPAPLRICGKLLFRRSDVELVLQGGSVVARRRRN